MNELKKRILEISYKNKLSHIGSCLASVDLIDKIYGMKSPDDPFILSNGHAGLALYCVLEKYEGKNAEELWKKHGTHPNRDKKDGIWCSSGSLGHGIGVAIGMAMANKERIVYCMVSDGECAEGSFWEALRIIADNKIQNLIILVIANGYGAYDPIDVDRLEWRIGSFIKDNCPKVSFNKIELKEPYMQGQNAHYITLTEDQYKEILAFYEEEEGRSN